MSDAFDLQEPADNGTPIMQRLIAAAEEAVSNEQIIAELEESLSEAKRRLNAIKTQALPDLMAEAGVSNITLDSGWSLKVEDFLAGSLPKDEVERDDAIEWLELNGAESLIKTELSINFKKSEHNMALDLAGRLENEGYDVSSKMGVHPQTLLAHIRERMKAGDPVPLEKLGLFAGRTTKIKAPSKKK